jgi:hypothetical protein
MQGRTLQHCRIRLCRPDRLGGSRNGPQLMQNIVSAAHGATVALDTLNKQDSHPAALWQSKLPAIRMVAPADPSNCKPDSWQAANMPSVRRCLCKSLAAASGTSFLVHGSILKPSSPPGGFTLPAAAECCFGCNPSSKSDVQQWLMSREQELCMQPAHYTPVAAAAPLGSSSGLQATTPGNAKQGKKRGLTLLDAVLNAEAMACSSSKARSAPLQDNMLNSTKRRACNRAGATGARRPRQHPPAYPVGVWHLLRQQVDF